MQHRRSAQLLALTVAAGLAVAACGSSSSSSTTTAAPAATTTAAPGTTAGPGTTAAATTSLKGICPDDVGIQTDWMPEAEHGFLYQMVGKGYTVDKGKAVVTGPLVDSKGNDTGVTEIGRAHV